MRRIGIVGFGHLGQYLVNAIQEHPDLELAFIWNRDKGKLHEKFQSDLILGDLENYYEKHPNLIIEVCHPCITKEYGAHFLRNCDYMIGSPTALADRETENVLRNCAVDNGIYIPSGAFWGGEDIKKMANRNTLKGLKVTMKKHPASLKLNEPLKSLNDSVLDKPMVLYEGPVRQLCQLAPNNVNTMAAAAIAGHNLGFDGVEACLVADPSLSQWHVIEIEVTGPGENKQNFTVHTVRKNPALIGAVTGEATYNSFLCSLLGADRQGPGIHLC